MIISRIFKIICGISAMYLLYSCAPVTVEQQTNGWRGENRNGIYNETGLLTAWDTVGPPLLWFVTGVGKGFSSPVALNDKVFVTGLDFEEDDSLEVFSAFTVKGEKLYQTTYGSAWTKAFPGTRTTPSIVKNMAYMISSMGEVVCINTDDGKIVWKVDGKQTFEGQAGKWGNCESPLVIDDKVIFTPGGKQTTVVALNTATGETVWKSDTLGELCSYTSPLLINHNGKRQIVGFTEFTMFGINPNNGNFEWTFKDWDFDYKGGMDGICANTPIYSDGKLFVSNGYGMNSYLFELNDDATEIKLVWRNKEFGVHHGGMVLIDNVIYGSNFFRNSMGNWMALDWHTGDIKYQTDTVEWRSKGSIISADNLLYCYEEKKGAILLVNPNPEKFDVISEFIIPQGDGPRWSHLSIHKGVLYVRRGDALMAFNLTR